MTYLLDTCEKTKNTAKKQTILKAVIKHDLVSYLLNVVLFIHMTSLGR